MRTTIRLAFSLLASAVGSGLHSAGAHAAPYDCTTVPTDEQCRTPAYLTMCDSAAMRRVCQPKLDASLQQGATIERKVFTPNQPKLLRNLVDGKARPFVFSAPARTWGETLLDSMSQSLSKEERRARQAAWSLPADPAHADAWTRNAAWESNGIASTSCEEVVYDNFYTYQRFLDATYRCQQDASCIADLADKRFLPTAVAPSSRGGIRDLRTRWGTASPVTGAIPNTHAILPKNVFTTQAAVSFLPDSVINLFAGNGGYDVLLRNKREYMFNKRYAYGIGMNGAFRYFPSEVDYHITLRDLVRAENVSAAEQADMRRRQEELSSRMRDFVQRYSAHHMSVPILDIDGTGHVVGSHPSPTMPAAHGKVVPLDPLADRAFINIVGTIPWDMSDRLILEGMDYFSATRDFVEGQLTNGLGPVYHAENTAFQHSYFPNIGGTVEDAFAHTPVTRDATSSVLKLRCPSAAPGWVPADDRDQMADDACKISNLILAEASRDWIQSDRGCLTANFEGCDWSPEEFAERFATKQFATKERDDLLQQCEKLTRDFDLPASFIPQGPVGPNHAVVPIGTTTFAMAKSDGAKMRTFLANADAAIRDTIAMVPTTSPSNPSGFGQTLRRDELIGDKSLFAGGYSGSMGWTAELIKGPDNKLCRMNATMHGDLDVDAYIFNGHTSIVDAGALASVIDGVGHADAHLNVMGRPMFQPVDQTVALNGIINELWDRREDDSTTLGTITFSAGPVPITLSAGASWFYGANFTTQLRAPSTCLPNQNKTTLATLLESNTTFEPFAGVDGWVSIEAGVPGLLSVGINADVNVITVSVPVFGNVRVGIAPNALGYTNEVAITFDAGAKLVYSTLSGAVDLTFKALFIPVEVNLFKWKGISGESTLVKNPAITIPLFMIPASTAH